MRKNVYIFSMWIIIFSLVLSSITTISKADDSVREIIIFDSTLTDNVVKENIIKKYGALKVKDLDVINGMTILISEKNRDLLKLENGIKRIEDDVIIQSDDKESIVDSSVSTQPLQIEPWGITRIKANLTTGIKNDKSVKIAILDSGIDLSHPDLKDNIKDGYNMINKKESFNDGYGHGSHVAGVIAAINNNIGVVGVAPKICVYAVKVLDDQGMGHVSDLIEGIEWSIKKGIAIINMSVQVSSNSQALHDAIIKANEKNIIQVASAGNNPDSPVMYPAAYPEVISVTATDINDHVGVFCSNGKVDISAPGVDVYSTYKDAGYTVLSGTSMAAPHVSGAVAILLSVPSKCDLNGDGNINPNEVKQRLQETSKDLGTEGIDDIYGSGLLDLYKAVYQ